MYTKLEEALHFVMKCYEGQKRRNDNINRSYQPIVVANMIRNINDIEDVTVAALLHRTIMDTEYGYEEIEEMFGTLVADMVSDLSEYMSIAKWLYRKKDFIKRMKQCNDIDVINIVVAAKLADLLGDYQAFLKRGDKIWKDVGGSKEENAYVYREIYSLAKRKRANSNLLERYKNMIIIYFGEIDEED
jgi:(p)ppGpp synthase/HD superfamily hydrolase